MSGLFEAGSRKQREGRGGGRLIHMNRSKPITERQQAFLDAYRVHGKVKPAAEQVGCSRELHYGAMRTSETYREEFSLVQMRRADELEEAMWQRAVYGVKIPKFYRGEIIGYDIRYSDVLLMRLMEANDPEKFSGVRQELQQQSREDGFCVRWDRDEVRRPTLPRMTGPQPPAPPRPPRPPVPSISECGIPVTYAEWAAARGITGRADCGPVDQEVIQRWAAGGECSPVEWVSEEAAMELGSDDADTDLCQVGVAGIDDPESADRDVDVCVRWGVAEPDDGSALQASAELGVGVTRPGGPGWGTGCPFRPKERSERTGTPECQVGSRCSAGTSRRENAVTVGRFPVRKRLRRGQGRTPAPRQALGRRLRPQRPATFGHALPQSLQGVPHTASRAPTIGVAALLAQPIVPRRPGPAGRWRPRLNLVASRAPPIGVAVSFAQPIAPRRAGPGLRPGLAVFWVFGLEPLLRRQNLPGMSRGLCAAGIAVRRIDPS